MKPHPRIRKTIKWGGAAVAALLVVVWVGSGWWHAGYQSTSDLCFGVSDGALQVVFPLERGQFRSYTGFHANKVEPRNRYVGADRFHSDPTGYRWKFRWIGFPTPFGLEIPLWAIQLLVLLPTAHAWRQDAIARRRDSAKLCHKCGYDRTGLAADAKCPECGRTPA